MRTLRRKCAGMILCWLLSCGLVGCTGDPNQGGIFWSESKANDRLSARRAALAQVRRDAAHDQAANDALHQQRGDLRQQTASQRAALARIDTDLARLRAEVRANSAAETALGSQLREVENRRAALRESDRSTEPADTTRQEQELATLRAQVAQLKERDELLRQTR